MVLKSDGKSEHILRTHEGKYNFSEEKIRALTFIDIIKCLTKDRITKIKPYERTAPLSELPSNIGTMGF